MAYHKGFHSYLWKDLEDYPQFKKDFLNRLKEEEEAQKEILNKASKEIKTSRGKRKKKAEDTITKTTMVLSWLDGIQKEP